MYYLCIKLYIVLSKSNNQIKIIMKKYNDILSVFEELRNKECADKMAAYMRNNFTFYGIPTPQRKAVCKDLLKSEKKSKVVDWQFLDKCWMNEHREFQYLVINYLSTMQEFLVYDDVAHIEKYARTKQWWDTIDGLDRIIGNIAFVDSRINDLMLKWSTDDDFWIRRIAIDHQLLRKEKTDTTLLEKILTNNFGSSEFFINKAIGWSLRDYSKTNPDWVRAFIEKYRGSMNSLSIREASKYI